MLPTPAQRVRLAVFEHFRDHGVPPTLEDAMRDFAMGRDEAAATFAELQAARHLALVPGTSRILMAFPFSAIATPFRVEANSRRYFANCAWDAIAFHAMLAEPVTVDALCHHCAAAIRVRVEQGSAGADPSSTIVHFALPPTRWWDDIVTTCSNTMVFFCSAAHRDASDLCGPADATVSLTPDQVHALSGPIYAHKLAIDYARPSREELLDHFAAIGLTGPYWQL